MNSYIRFMSRIGTGLGNQYDKFPIFNENFTLIDVTYKF